METKLSPSDVVALKGLINNRTLTIKAEILESRSGSNKALAGLFRKSSENELTRLMTLKMKIDQMMAEES